MNNCIKELARLAGLAYAEDFGGGFPDIKYPPGTEKFAELIVRECWTSISPFIEDDKLAEDALAEIKDHFGIEE